MSKQLIFVDDSGDPGFKSVSSDNFVMAAAVFIEPEVAESMMREISEYRESLGWKYNHEFKFTKNPKNVVVEMLKRASNYDFKVYAVYIEKKDFRDITPEFARFFDREKLYNWTIKELLRGIPMKTAKITIDGRASNEDKKNTKTYLRRELTSADRTKKIDITIQDSVRTDLLQLADLIAGSINRSLQPDKTNSNTYISIFKNKIVEVKKITFR